MHTLIPAVAKQHYAGWKNLSKTTSMLPECFYDSYIYTMWRIAVPTKPSLRGMVKLLVAISISNIMKENMGS